MEQAQGTQDFSVLLESMEDPDFFLLGMNHNEILTYIKKKALEVSSEADASTELRLVFPFDEYKYHIDTSFESYRSWIADFLVGTGDYTEADKYRDLISWETEEQ